ncbi:hypothetical protein VTK56DRAFT_2888 [Thermocarpiscus australiensis]
MYAVSENSLQYVLQFPKLEIFDVTFLGWRTESIAAEYGWKVTYPTKRSVFVSYAEAYLDGRAEVQMPGVEVLRPLFEDDRQQVSLVPQPRDLLFEKDKDPDRTTYLDERWRALLQGTHPCFPATDGQDRRDSVAFPPSDRESRDEDDEESQGESESEVSREEDEPEDVHVNFGAIFGGGDGSASAEEEDGASEHSDDYSPDISFPANDMFWFMALLSQKEYNLKRTAVRPQVAGITLPSGRFMSLRLRGQSRQLSTCGRIILSRKSKANMKNDQRTAQRPKERRGPRERSETNLKPRKRQKVGDLLSSFGVPQGGAG